MPEEIEFDPREDHEKMEEIREEHGDAKHKDWMRLISLSTAVLAVVAAIAALMSGSLVNEALFKSSEAVEAQAKASDQWAYYQAKGIKGNTAKQTADLLSAAVSAKAGLADHYREESKRYGDEQGEAKHRAEEFEKERTERNAEADELMHQHHKFAYCVTITQVAIALSAIAALTRNRPVWYGSLVMGAIGAAMLAWGFLR